MTEKKKEMKLETVEILTEEEGLGNLEQTGGQIDEHQTNGQKKEKKSEVKVEKEIEKKKKDLKLEDIPGVGAATAEKLRDAGYANLLSVAVASPGELVEACGVGDAVARKMINFVRQKMDMGFESGEDLLKKREMVERIITGSKALDAIFGGGIETGAVTEVYGAYGSGKSSLGHQLAANVALSKEEGGANGIAVWIDTEGTLRPEFIKRLAIAKGLDPEKLLKNFKGVRAFNSDHQMLLAEKIEDLINEGSPIKLVVVDSLMGHFRSEFVGRGTLADRQQKLNKHMHVLLKLAQNHNIAVLITNQVMAKPDTFFGDPTEPIGGHIVAHNSTYRVYLRRGKKGTRVAKMVDAPAMPEAEAIFQVTDEGIKDV